MTSDLPSALFDIEPLVPHLEAGAVVLTPNRRLAQAIVKSWGGYCVQCGLEVWRQPSVWPIEDWLAECWQHLQDRGYQACLTGSVATANVESLLWESAIIDDGFVDACTQAAAFARKAQDAFHNLICWEVPLTDIATSGHEPVLRFLQWQARCQTLLREKDLMTLAESYQVIAKAYDEAALPIGNEVVLIGFQNPPSPLHRRIVESAYNEVVEWQSSRAVADARLFLADNDAAEIAAAAAWARDKVRENPSRRIGVVLPQLTKNRYRVERLFREAFAPEYVLPQVPRGVPTYNISAGYSSSDAPLVRSALRLLRLHRATASLEYYVEVINDPFWGRVFDDQIIRARCQVLLRDGDRVEPGGGDFRACMERAEAAVSDLPSGLSQCLQNFQRRCREQPAYGDLVYWSREFTERLALLGWPGPRSLDSIEYQQHQHWLDLLGEFEALDLVTGEVDVDQALNLLARLCRETPFQPESDETPVQVLGLLEASGLKFDALWLAEMHDEQWPQTPQYNPLLPVDLQRRSDMPKASVEQELGLARRMLQTFKSNTDLLVCSFGRYEGDTERQLTPLVDSLFSCDSPGMVSETDTEKALTAQPVSAHPLMPRFAPVTLERITVDKAPPLDLPDAPLRGGSALLRDQALCPFNAFALWRLGAQPLSEPQPGMNYRDRGVVIHRVMQLFWQATESQANLLAMRGEDIQARLGVICKRVLQPFKTILGERFVDIETERLCRLCSAWLDIERARAPFEVVGLEVPAEITLGELRFSLRLDRVDRLTDGRLAVIDYKTGNTLSPRFSADRPEEPQLFMYALTRDEPLAELSFAQISAQKVQRVGLSDDPEVARPMLELRALGLESWTVALQTWRHQLTEIAAEFRDGDASVIFYTREASRFQNYLLPLNRYLETLAEPPDSGDEVLS